MSLLDAATTLSDIANAPSATYEDAMDAARLVLEAAEEDPDQVDGAVRILLAAVRAEDDERAGIGAIICGALVDKGADPLLASEHVVERFLDVVRTASRYLGACREHFENHILSDEAECEVCGPGEDETDTMMPQVREAVSEKMPEGEPAWIALELFCRPTVTLLTLDADARRVLSRDVALINALGALAVHKPGAYFVWALLSLLDDEQLLVVDPQAGLAWDVRIDGVADNFQLHLLLAHALISAGHLDGEPLDEEVLGVVSGEGPPLLDEHVMGYWNLYNWTGLSADGTLPDGYFDQGSQHLIWNEGVPADIRTLQGRRVILLGPSPVIRQWRPGRLFEPLRGSVVVERQLPVEELEVWFDRIRQELQPPSV